MKRWQNFLWIAAIILFMGATFFINKYFDWLWFKSMGAFNSFWIPLITGPLVKFLAGFLIFCCFMINLFIARKAFGRVRVYSNSEQTGLWPDFSRTSILLPGLLVAGILSFILASGFTVDWKVIQQFLNQVTVGTTDPIFNKDLGFFLFSLPFFSQLITLLQSTLIMLIIYTIFLYVLAKALTFKDAQLQKWDLWPPAKIHLALITIFLLIIKVWSYQLGKYNLMFTENIRLTGINYTAAHSNLLAADILSGLVIAVIAVIIISLFQKGIRLLLGSLGAWLLASVILWVFYPNIIQSFVVTPNEYELEKQYLQNHIKFTRAAYGLNEITNQVFRPDNQKMAQLEISDPALSNLRLWDYKPLKPSYNQLQSIRPYYQFNDIDIDRYPSAKGQWQIMLAARELNTNRLSEQAKTWINLHLTYTHGYGITANEVSEFSNQGQPIFIARDIPTKNSKDFDTLKVTEPRIYFGESTNNYIIVGTKTSEFDYPQGEENKTTKYQGPKGIPINSFPIKMLMAMRFSETNFLLSPQITKDSNLLIYRNIRQRVLKLAPFLLIDNDPYLVVAKGKLHWIIDAYTYSSYYPYSKYHQHGMNYLRNSVKVLINAYTGKVDFYVIDEKDPVIRVWQKVFPKLLKSAANIDPEIAAHFRYPEYIMNVQRDMLLQYHMTNTKTFYEKEDYWTIPYENKNELFEPYYANLQLPGQTANEFVMVQPFSPRGKQNLIAWLAARCDAPNYGKLVLYKLPKDQNIYGPAQIESRMYQDQNISQLVTLWNQQQSRVLWGNLLLIPLEKSILYVKPLYMESENSQQAELKRIVMVYQNQVVIGTTILDAINQIKIAKGKPISKVTKPEPGAPGSTAEDDDEQLELNQRQSLIRQLQKSIREQQKLFNQQKKLLEKLRKL